MSKLAPWPLALGVLVALYPVGIYLGLHYVEPRWIALLLILATGVRLLASGTEAGLLWTWLAAALLAGGATVLTGSELGLLLYPVLVNAVLLTLFLLSLRRPPTVIERLARLREPDLPPAAVAYTRKVTIAWCLFFAGNGVAAAVTIALGRGWWALYNGLIAYVLMAILMGGEFLIRQRVREKHLA